MANKGLLTKIKKYSNPTPKKKSSKQTNSLVRSTQHLPLSSRHLFTEDDVDQSDMAMETSVREKFINKSSKREDQHLVESNLSPFELFSFL